MNHHGATDDAVRRAVADRNPAQNEAEFCDAFVIERDVAQIAGVTLGLMHGALPHAMVLCAQPSRTTIHRNPWVQIPSLSEMIRLYESAMEPLRPSPVIAIALNTFDLDDREARKAIERARSETGLPTTDPVRYEPLVIAEAIAAFHVERMAERTVLIPPATFG